ncbi:MAG: glycerol-3-phosphate acyltransferase, partial [Bacteroidota bacterium]
VFAQFRGGKGVHCSAGVLLAVNPMATLVCGITALVIFFISRFPNLGYLVASIALPVFVWASRNSYGEYLLPMIIFGILLFLFIFMSHRRNLIDIIKGIEAPSTLLVNT